MTYAIAAAPVMNMMRFSTSDLLAFMHASQAVSCAPPAWRQEDEGLGVGTLQQQQRQQEQEQQQQLVSTPGTAPTGMP